MVTKRTRSSMRCLVLIALFATAVSDAQTQSAKQKRENAYQAKLQSYSDALKPGMTRKDVEDYLRAKGTAFRQLCCNHERSALADLVNIGKEKHPWHCEEHNVYITFQFAAVEVHKDCQAYDSDMLKKITIFHKLEGCL
jgi:transcription termination factor NusB